MSIIAEVIAHYGTYTAALERQFIAAQQIRPRVETVVSGGPRRTYDRHFTRNICGTVYQVLAGNGGWMSTGTVAMLTGIHRTKVAQAMQTLIRDGKVERQSAKRIHREQRYRSRGTR